MCIRDRGLTVSTVKGSPGRYVICALARNLPHTPVLDKSLLIANAQNGRDSQTAPFRAVLLGGTRAAAEVEPGLVENCNHVGRALRDQGSSALQATSCGSERL